MNPEPWWSRFDQLTRDEVNKIWSDFADGVSPFDGAPDRDWVNDIDPGDPATWNPESPLNMLLCMAAAGDLRPLAAALAAAAPQPEPGRDEITDAVCSVSRDGVTITYRRPANEIMAILLIATFPLCAVAIATVLVLAFAF